MAFPADAVQPLLDCMNSEFTWPDISLPGLPSFSLAAFSSMFAGIDFALDFVPPDSENLPGLPLEFDLFIDPVIGGLKYNGDLGAIDLSIVLPGAPTIPATGTDIQFPQFGFINIISMVIAAPFEIMTRIIQSIIDLDLSLPSLQDIIDILNDLAITLGMVAELIADFILCFAQGLFNMITALFP